MLNLYKSLPLLPAAFVLTIAPAALAELSEAERDQAAANFVVADADGDRVLTLSEFTTLIDLNADHDIGRSQTVRRFGAYETAFGRIDANADGLVTPDELAEASGR